MAHPTPDHWLPLIYAYAAADDGDPVRFPAQGFDLERLRCTSQDSFYTLGLHLP